MHGHHALDSYHFAGLQLKNVEIHIHREGGVFFILGVPYTVLWW